MDSSYKNHINNYWGNHWENNPIGFNPLSATDIYKFKKLIKPALDKLIKGASVIEIGSGSCQWLLACRAYRPDLKIFGVDLANKSVQIGKERGIEVIQADIRDMPFEDNSFDFSFSWGVIEHMTNSDKAVKEQLRITSKFSAIDVPNYFSLPSIVIRKDIKRRKMSDYESMIEYGRFFNKKDFMHLFEKDNIKKEVKQLYYGCNYQVLPGKLSFLDKYLPDFLRNKLGHNIGTLLEII